ncbi:patatin-like phospholipase family protein [Parasutterella secunda]|uniref:Patatin-like phospholipase family protein n=1 Tax=Parasutterella secunda TaxID=626947 RepID=A0ABS2GPY2_9BURK|nr:patatin-like phospholipase family protein [Parasutterella secunda]MBM6927870.1 patatin-like phospholipase family protein [Parasutterella secunda]
MFVRPLCIVLLCLIQGWISLFAAQACAAAIENPELARPKVALVLSGGGARGFSHVGVIKVLEELGVKVDIVTGTSMGAMVGGGYASGYSVEQMQDIILGVDWTEMFALRPDRSDLNWRRRQDDFKGLGSGEMGLSDNGVLFPDSVVPAQHLEIFLRSITKHVSSVTDLSELSIPFAALATDLDSGYPVVMQKDVTLADAMRSSMSVPGAFSPFPYKGRVLVDGGLAQNLPVEQAKAMGADIIIAVNAGTPLGKSKDIQSVAGVMGQVVGILTERNVDYSKSLLTERDILITTDLEGFGAGDFDKAEAIIKAGEKSARAYEKELRRLAVPRKQYLAWNENRMASVKPPAARSITSVKVEGLQTVNPAGVIKSAGLNLEEPVTEEQIAEASARIWAMDDFTLVPYEIEPGPNGTQTLIWRPQEKPWGYNTIRVGGKVSTDFNQEHSFDFLLAHTMGWLNSWGGEWRNEAQIGKDSYFSTSLYQPLGEASPIFVMPEIRFESQRYDWYNGSSHAEATMKNSSLEGSVSLGIEFGKSSVLTAGLGYISAQSKVSVGHINGYESMDDTAAFAELTWRYDTLDNINFPSKGFYLDVEARRYTHMANSADTQVSDYYVETLLPWDWGDGWISLLSAKAGSSTIPGRYPLGGLFNMSGAYYGRYSGSDMFLGRMMLMKRLNQTDLFGFPLYVGGGFEMGRVQEDVLPDYLSDKDLGVWKKAFSAYVAADSLFGPVYLALGNTTDGDSALYFFWGRPLQ